MALGRRRGGSLMWIICFSLVLILLTGRPAMAAEEHLCGIMALFNPLGSMTLIDNFQRAREWSRRQGLRLVIAVLAFDDGVAQYDVLNAVREDNLTVILRINVTSVHTALLFQKEALLNRALDSLRSAPWPCSIVTWLDSDVMIQDGWIDSVVSLFSNNPKATIVQPFAELKRLLRRGSEVDFTDEAFSRRGKNEGESWPSAAASLGLEGFPGYAWSARRHLLEQVRFYDRAVVGGFDALLLHALVDPRCEARHTEAMAEHYWAWAAKAHRVLGPGLVPMPGLVRAVHLWHGERAKRMYAERHNILVHGSFDPTRDVELDDQGVLHWTSHANPEMVRAVAQMFTARHVD